MRVAMTVAGSDPIGGAGIQADLKSFANVGVHGTSVITCVTAQNTVGVSSVLGLGSDMVLAQMDSIMSDVDVRAVKTGMLFSVDILESVCDRLRTVDVPLVVDPVLVAGSGDSLAEQGLVDAMCNILLPMSTLVTPNVSEAEALSGIKVTDEDSAFEAADRMVAMGAESVLIKGGHLEGDSVVDLLFHGDELIRMAMPRLGIAGHGGGCTLSAYITGCLAQGHGVKESVARSRGLMQDAIALQYPIGSGARVVDQLASVHLEMERYQVLVRLRSALARLESILPSSWVPEVGIDFVFALPHARDPKDVCALEGRVVNVAGRPAHAGSVGFGASQHMAKVVLAAMHHDPSLRSAVNLGFTEERVVSMAESGLTTATFDRAEEPEGMSTMEWGSHHAISERGDVPDVIFDRGGVGKEPMIRVIGECPEDVLGKLYFVLMER